MNRETVVSKPNREKQGNISADLVIFVCPLQVLNDTFPDHTFLMNGLIVGIKGLLSFLSAPLIGALSDSLGRKFFLLITVAFTCAPIPLMIINTWLVSLLSSPSIIKIIIVIIN